LIQAVRKTQASPHKRKFCLPDFFFEEGIEDMSESKFSRWPINDEDRRKVVETLLECVANGSPMHSIRAARVLMEIDVRNRHNEISIGIDELQEIIEQRKQDEGGHENV
jgi:hypothetical protein